MTLIKKRLTWFLIVLFIASAVMIVSYHYWQHENEADYTLTLYGNVDMREVQLAFMVQDRITELNVDEGERVKRGQLLGRLDATRFESAVQELMARLEQAQQQLGELEAGSRSQEIQKAKADVAAEKASLVDAEKSYHRIQKLVNENFLSPQTLDDARGKMDVARARLQAAIEALSLAQEGPRREVIAAARANVAQTKAQLKRARKDLADTQLFAPADGVIRSRILEPGDIATITRPVFTLAKLEPVWIRAYVPETYLGRVVPGMSAQIHTDSFPGETYSGWVGYISPTAEFTPKSVETPALRTRLVYQIRVYACNSENVLRLGMPVTVVLDTKMPLAGKMSSDCSNM